ncbi:MAG: M23 family metallopeptidase [Bacteroidales bacterium]|nr:M23 family metallopeptidase [Bacteroidales bacterium]
MKRFNWIYILFLTIQLSAQNQLIAPLDIPLFMSGSFAELRSNHYHSGVDFKTNEQIGLPVYSVDEGWISRIKISPWGYGNAIYIDHPSGITSVYGHLNNFIPEIEKLIRNLQYQKRSESIDQYFQKDEYKINRGQVIAFSGNTGGSGGPHLHFETRRTNNQEPFNPLSLGFDVQDHRHPIIRNLMVNFNNNQKIIPVNRINDSLYSIESLVELPQKYLRLSVDIIDFSDGSPNKLGVNEIEFIVNGIIIYTFNIDQFSFDISRYVNAHIEYAYFKEKGTRYHKLYTEPGDLSNLYPINQDFEIPYGEEIPCQLNIVDSKGNRSVLNFNVLAKKEEVAKESKIKFLNDQLIDYTQSYHINYNHLILDFAKNSFYRNFYLSYKEIADSSLTGHLIFQIHKDTEPVHKYFKMKYKNPNIQGVDRHKICFAEIENGQLSYVSTKHEKDYIVGSSRNFGNFTLFVDTVAPRISFKSDIRVNESRIISFNVADNFSGVDYYNAYIDGNWVLLKYDYKNKALYYQLDDYLMANGQERTMKVLVKDALNNASEYIYKFIY